MKPKIITVLSVAGQQQYFDFAEISIPSFCRNNPDHPLYIFTDRITDMDVKYRINAGYNVQVFNYHLEFKLIHGQCKKIIDATYHRMHNWHNHDRAHVHKFVSCLLPMAQNVCDSEYILKIDADSYFRGPFMQEVEKEITGKHDLYLVERVHPLMLVMNSKLPGVGFCLWRKDSKFMEYYVNKFNNYEQPHIIKGIVNWLPTKYIKWPGAHFVYPFRQEENSGRPFTQEDYLKFNPSYFHCGGSNVLEKLKKLEAWDNEM